MSAFKLSRRQLLQASLVGGAFGTSLVTRPHLTRSAAAPGALAGAPRVAHGNAVLDAYERLRTAVRFRHKISLFDEAFAGTTDDTVVITVKVMNLMHTPFCFKFGQLNADGTVTVNGTVRPWASGVDPKIKTAAIGNMLVSKGIDKVSDVPRFGALRLNKWFADILNTGKFENGQLASGLSAGDVGPFPAETALQCAVGMNLKQTNLNSNHSQQNTCLSSSNTTGKGGDLPYHLDQNKIITSPFGLVCFNAGAHVQTTDGTGSPGNRLLDNTLGGIVANGQSVASYVSVLTQAIGLGLIDDSLAAKFDALTNADPSLAAALVANRTTLANALQQIGPIAAIESTKNVMNGTGDDGLTFGNLQVLPVNDVETNNQLSELEFIAQCKFVKAALDIPGKPFRNFTLLLNVKDLDGDNFDVALSRNKTQPLGYVEGMRQLAVGMNVLAQAIKAHGNVYVAVVTEGGRDASAADNDAGHAFLMGPAGAGNLVDALYCDQGSINSATDSFGVDSNGGQVSSSTTAPAAFRVFSQDQIIDADTSTVASGAFCDNSSFMLGLVKYLEGKIGAAATSTTGLKSGNYLVLRTG